jgi:hypothetical protein
VGNNHPSISREAVSFLNHATLNFNLVTGVTLEEQTIAETLTENVLDVPVEVSS